MTVLWIHNIAKQLEFTCQLDNESAEIREPTSGYAHRESKARLKLSPTTSNLSEEKAFFTGWWPLTSFPSGRVLSLTAEMGAGVPPIFRELKKLSGGAKPKIAVGLMLWPFPPEATAPSGLPVVV